jgi:hypothetical protein
MVICTFFPGAYWQPLIDSAVHVGQSEWRECEAAHRQPGPPDLGGETRGRFALCSGPAFVDARNALKMKESGFRALRFPF